MKISFENKIIQAWLVLLLTLLAGASLAAVQIALGPVIGGALIATLGVERGVRVSFGIALVLAYQFALEPLLDSQKRVQDEIILKKKMLTRYLEFIKSGKEVEDGQLRMF